ncbi:MAG: hypothetical protein MK171_03095 [Pirellulales bacterium]|nr:hypothetical protein [Pirellulales bacterium]
MSKLHVLAELEVVGRGPDWLFIRLRPDPEHLDDLAERLWKLMNKHFIHRLVLEMDEVEYLPRRLIGQLVMLQRQVLQHDGALRLCGLSVACTESLHLCRLDQALPNFVCREDAVRGCKAAKPR